MSDVETGERTLTRKQAREAKRSEKQNLLANLVRCRNAWETKPCPRTPEGMDFNTHFNTFYAQKQAQVRWLNKQIALFKQRESKQHGPIQE